MLRMPEFAVHQPTSAAEAVQLHAELPGAMYIAGGTDLLPNLKHHLHAPEHLISLSRLPLAGISADGGALTIGAGTSLQDIADSEVVRSHAPALALAASVVAGPQHRRMGTLGGNVMLDTRCLYYNQTATWRTALGFCLKKDGDWCHVVQSGKTCVAAQSADTVPVLIGRDAHLRVLTVDGETAVSMRKLYRQDGRCGNAHVLDSGALLTAIEIPAAAEGRCGTYRKVRSRGAVDFPQLALALHATIDGDEATDVELVVGALLPKPKRVRLADRCGLEDTEIEGLAASAHRRIRPQANIHGDPAWRRHMVRVEVARGLRALRDDPTARIHPSTDG